MTTAPFTPDTATLSWVADRLSASAANAQIVQWLRHAVKTEKLRPSPTPPADDVREALTTPGTSAPGLTAAIAQAEQSVARYESQNAGDPFRFDLIEHRYVALRGLLAALSAPLRASLLRLDVNPLDAWTVDEWAQVMDRERARQIADGYDDSHDAEHGIPHLLNWSIDYARRGKTVAAATLARCALRLLPAEVRPRGTVTDADAEWEYVPGEIWTDRFGGTHVAVQNGVIARGGVNAYIAEGGDVLRRKVGPWETVTAEVRS